MTPFTQEDWDLIREYNLAIANIANARGGARLHVLTEISQRSVGSVTLVEDGCVLLSTERSAINADGQEMRDIVRTYPDRIPSIRIIIGPNVKPPAGGVAPAATTPEETVPGTTIPIHPDTTPVKDYVYTV